MFGVIKNNKGQSLIELSVSIAITSIALLAILSLILIGIVTQRRSSNYYLAINLAREAIEATRNIRDTNWLINECYRNGGGCSAANWNDNLHKTGDVIYSAILRFDPENVFSDTNSKFDFEFIEDLPTTGDQSKIIYKKDFNSTTLYLDSRTCTLTYTDCQQTNFKRWVYLKPICDGSGPNAGSFSDFKCFKDPASTNVNIEQANYICDNGGVCDPSIAPQIGIRVSVEIGWQEGGRTNDLKLVDDLYDWR